MSVPKSRQSKSRLEVLYNATKLHDEIVALTLRSFGVYSRNSVLRHKYRTLVIQTKNEQYVDELVLSYKNLITQAANMVEVYLRQAIFNAVDLYVNVSVDVERYKEKQNYFFLVR